MQTVERVLLHPSARSAADALEVLANLGDRETSELLELLLEDFELEPLPIHVVHQGGRRIPAKVREFVDFCVAQLGANHALQGKEGG